MTKTTIDKIIIKDHTNTELSVLIDEEDNVILRLDNEFSLSIPLEEFDSFLIKLEKSVGFIKNFKQVEYEGQY